MEKRYTITYGHGSNEGPDGRIETCRSYGSRLETPEEYNETNRYAEAAFRKIGVKPQPARVEIFGDMARVLIGGRAVIVRQSDLQETA